MACSISIEASGFGLTLGVHSRIDATIDRVLGRRLAGNCYVNRNMIGAVVGTQPFGGFNLSGTGPKAGGPHYLDPFLSRTNGLDQHRGGGRERQSHQHHAMNRGSPYRFASSAISRSNRARSASKWHCPARVL